MKGLKLIRNILVALSLIMLGVLIAPRFNKNKPVEKVVDSTSWSKLTLILDQIEKNYVDTIDYSNVIEETIPHLLKELDPHSSYLPPVDLKQATEDLSGNFDGIGIVFNVPADTAIVMNVIVGGPSERAGLQSGDRIIKVDDKVVAGQKVPQDTMLTYMRGPAGTKVTLTVLRKKEFVDFEIIRAKIPIESIDAAYMVNDTTGYVKLSKFSRTSFKEFLVEVLPMKEKGLKKLIFDLRDNAGGYFDQAILLSNIFLEKGDEIVYLEGIHRSRQNFKADGSGLLKDIELDVLIDESSASSSEIFAGAIQDNDRGTIYGRRSYGKGLVQECVNFSDKSGIRLTVARFYTPSGRCIQKPYKTKDGKDYRYDIIERYAHGEMMEADSIVKNDSLVFKTKGGRTVYGGGGIIPDVFVPMDTVGVTDMYIEISTKALPVKFSMKMGDKYRDELREVKDLESLYPVFDAMDLEKNFLQYVLDNGVKFNAKEWKESRKIVITQLKAMIGRYSPLDDDAFYPIIADVDNVMQKVIEQ